MVFNIKSPFLGFENLKEMELTKIDDLFMNFASKDNDTSFTLVNPFALREYDFEIPVAYKDLLEIDEDTNVLILNIMIISAPIENSTVNFIAPLIFNIDKKIMAQAILDNSKYPNFGILEQISNYITA